MSIFQRPSQQRDFGDGHPIPAPGARRSHYTSPDLALRHSAVWACLRLRADLTSTLPVDLFKPQGGISLEVPKPEVLKKPGSLVLGGPLSDIDEWLYAGCMDKDRCGNAVGLIVERGPLNRPTRIDWVPHTSVVLRQRGAHFQWLIDGKEVPTVDIWHEKQFVVPGLPVGLSPVAYAAMAIGQYMNAQEFAVSWFGGTAHPSATLKNNKKTLSRKQSQAIKDQYNSTVAAGDVLVLGADWEYDMAKIAQAQAEFLSAQKFSVSDICRFFGVPGDMVDAEGGASNVTYANITQRNVQLLVMNLGPSIYRLERTLSRLVAEPQKVKLNTKALLRMDPLTQAQVIKSEIDSRTLDPDEARALQDRRPITSGQVGLFNDLFGNPNKTPTPGSKT